MLRAVKPQSREIVYRRLGTEKKEKKKKKEKKDHASGFEPATRHVPVVHASPASGQPTCPLSYREPCVGVDITCS